MDYPDKKLYVIPNEAHRIQSEVPNNAQHCEPIITKKYGSADEFLRDISYGGEFYTKLNANMAYRGLQSGTYELIPSVLRNKIEIKNLDGSDFIEPEDNEIQFSDSEETQRFKEYFDLRVFFELSDENSLRLPEVDRIRKYLLSYEDLGLTKRMTEEWPPYDLYELAALAQHYGMKTRLLDWSSSLDTAIYFAVHEEPMLKEEEKSCDEARYMVIWLLDTAIEHLIPNLKFIRPPYYGNPNLSAQKGLFSCWIEPGFQLSSNVISEEELITHMKVRVNRTPLDKRIADALKDNPVNQTYMWKLLIPRVSREELYKYINRKGVNAASLFPGYGGVVKHIQESNSFLKGV